MPDYENGYYLASYKCVCRENYEFPFLDYGSSYFEGATMEKEYDKKINGKPNIYDRLKCRPINLQSQFRQHFNSGLALVPQISVNFYLVAFTLVNIFSQIY